MTETTYTIGEKHLTLKQMDVRQMVGIVKILVDSLDASSTEKRAAAKSHLQTIISEIQFRLRYAVIPDENAISFCQKCNKTVCSCAPPEHPINEGTIEELYSMVCRERDQLFEENLRLRIVLTRIHNAAQDAQDSASSQAAITEILKESKEAL